VHGLSAAWLRGLPKAEVHVHLEGSLDPSLVTAAAALLRRATPTLPAGGFADLATFLSYLDDSCACITTAEQVSAALYEVARRAAAAGVRYVDLIWNPSHWPAWRDRLPEFVTAVDRGCTDAEADGLPPIGLCVSLLRRQSAREALELVERLVELRHRRVVGLSIDGNEAAAGRTGPRFAEAFARARAAGLRRCAHAGESSGPEGVVDALDYLGAERIDHGVRAVEDVHLIQRLANEGVPLDMCPTSNVRLGIAPSVAAHPLEHLRAQGVRVSVNTDDPVLFGTTVDAEYATCAAAFDWTHDDAAAVARTSIESCFGPDGLREDLLRDLAAYLRKE
jgi:adenosine deaminase